MSLHNLVTINIKEYFVSAHNNNITGFCRVDTSVLMDYIRTKYVTVLPKNLQENDI